MDEAIERCAGDRGAHTKSEVEELALEIKGLVFARAILEERGASEVELEEHRLEVERLRWRLASLIAERDGGYDAGA